MDNKKGITQEEKETAIKEIENLENTKIALTDKVRLDEIEIRIQEINVILENDEYLAFGSEKKLEDDQYFSLVDELKVLRKEKKEIIKKYKNSIFDRVPVWMIIYGVFQLVVNFYYSMFYIVLGFIDLLAELEWLTNNNLTDFVKTVILLFVPTLLLIASLCIWLFAIKDKFKKKVFLVIYSLQILMTIITMILLVKDLFG